MSFPAFWRNEELSEIERDLLDSLVAAHDLSARRENISTVICVNTFIGSQSIANAVAAACLTLGGPHAPIDRIMTFLTSQEAHCSVPADIVPGWGSDFVKGREDETFAHVKTFLGIVAPNLLWTIEEVTRQLHAKKKFVFPNPGCYTAAVALALGCPASVAPLLFILSRIPAWGSICLNAPVK